MLITSHLAVTLLVGKGLGLWGFEMVTALLMGVAIDLDHFLVNRKWVNDVKTFVFTFKSTHGEVKQHSWIQEPLFGLSAGVILGILLSFFVPSVRWWIFPAFQALHITMDGFMNYEHQPFAPVSRWKYWGVLRSNTPTEWFVSLTFLFVVILI